MVGVSASVNLPLHHKVQKFSSGTVSPGWSRKKGRKTVVVDGMLLRWLTDVNYFVVCKWCQAQPVSEELVEKLLGSGVSVSPVVTIEPRHRKFHQPISITIPLPPKSSLRGGKTRPAAGTPTLRLLCSMTG